MGQIFTFNHPLTIPGVVGVATKKLNPIGSAVFTFIGYKQTSQIFLIKLNKRQNSFKSISNTVVQKSPLKAFISSIIFLK